MKTSIKFSENYFLTKEVIGTKTDIVIPKKTNHIFVVDVSGSMNYELPLIRTQLKNKLSNIMKEGDTISIVWFSGRNNAGILKEEVEVKSLKALSDLNDAIDKWLRPISLTAFLKPLELVRELVGRIKKNRPDSIFSMIFLTDGYNNDCSWDDVIKTLKSLEKDIISSTFVEYGYYADSCKLAEMAAILGGEKISCDGFDDFEPIFDAKISSNICSDKKVLVEITDKYLYDFAFSIDNSTVLLYNIADSKIMIGSNVKEIYYFSPSANNIIDITKDYPIDYINDTALYGAMYVLADKLLNDDVEKIFYTLGDSYYYRMFSIAFGKQKLNAFKSAIKECIGNATKRFIDGRGKINKIDENAYCFMNLIDDLGKMNAKFYPNHPEFHYNKIGRRKISAASILTDTDKLKLSEVKNIEEAKSILKELEEKKIDIKFTNTNPDRSYPITDIVWNEERANLNVRIYIEGEVNLPSNKFGIDKIASFKYNTFTLIKDGIVNVEKLPIEYDEDLKTMLIEKGVNFNVIVEKNRIGDTIVIDLSSLPIINKGMVKTISANALAKLEWELVKLQANKKVYDYYKRLLFPKTSKSFAEMLGQECADWLKEIGITDYNGYAPKVISAESTDFYMSVRLATKIKGLSSLPKVEDVITKINTGKELKLNEWIMSDAIKKYRMQIESDLYKSLDEKQQLSILKTYLETKSEILDKQKRMIMQEIAEIKFSLILSKKWFVEFKSFDENKLQLKLDDQCLDFTFDLSEKEEKI